jgi:hypothetical protein
LTSSGRRNATFDNTLKGAPQGSDIMNRLRRLAIALLAAATVAAGSLVGPTMASAMPMSCEVRYQLSTAYYATAQILYSLGDYTGAFFWAGKAYGIVAGC